uniref:Uncharacterized protein n=1 Tax=viral metagenome TaxID=1070528 RepID=A0A6H1ZWW8_9ZZZZ
MKEWKFEQDSETIDLERLHIELLKGGHYARYCYLRSLGLWAPIVYKRYKNAVDKGRLKNPIGECYFEKLQEYFKEINNALKIGRRLSNIYKNRLEKIKSHRNFTDAIRILVLLEKSPKLFVWRAMNSIIYNSSVTQIDYVVYYLLKNGEQRIKKEKPRHDLTYSNVIAHCEGWEEG